MAKSKQDNKGAQSKSQDRNAPASGCTHDTWVCNMVKIALGESDRIDMRSR